MKNDLIKEVNSFICFRESSLLVSILNNNLKITAQILDSIREILFAFGPVSLHADLSFMDVLLPNATHTFHMTL